MMVTGVVMVTVVVMVMMMVMMMWWWLWWCDDGGDDGCSSLTPGLCQPSLVICRSATPWIYRKGSWGLWSPGVSLQLVLAIMRAIPILDATQPSPAQKSPSSYLHSAQPWVGELATSYSHSQAGSVADQSWYKKSCETDKGLSRGAWGCGVGQGGLLLEGSMG